MSFHYRDCQTALHLEWFLEHYHQLWYFEATIDCTLQYCVLYLFTLKQTNLINDLKA